jgi:hypothetical protein
MPIPEGVRRQWEWGGRRERLSVLVMASAFEPGEKLGLVPVWGMEHDEEAILLDETLNCFRERRDECLDACRDRDEQDPRACEGFLGKIRIMVVRSSIGGG